MCYSAVLQRIHLSLTVLGKRHLFKIIWGHLAYSGRWNRSAGQFCVSYEQIHRATAGCSVSVKGSRHAAQNFPHAPENPWPGKVRTAFLFTFDVRDGLVISFNRLLQSSCSQLRSIYQSAHVLNFCFSLNCLLYFCMYIILLSVCVWNLHSVWLGGCSVGNICGMWTGRFWPNAPSSSLWKCWRTIWINSLRYNCPFSVLCGL